jgi:thioredoxin
MPQILQGGTAASPWCVACLCAAWCDICGDYRGAFENLGRQHAADAFVWIDIEDDSEWIGELEIENFPTLLICHGAAPHFFGPVQPHIEQLRKLLASVKANNSVLSQAGADLEALVARIRNVVGASAGSARG